MNQPQKMICKWTEDENGAYDSECNNKFEFLGGSSPEENGFIYCPYCGKKIKV